MGYISFKSDYLEFGLGTTPVITLSTGSYVGIAAVNPGTCRLYVSGTAYSTGGWTSSDIRWKKNIVPVTAALEKIVAMEGVN